MSRGKNQRSSCGCPPLQRLEAKGKSMMRINAMPDAAMLPQDSESIFYFNVREVPPKSERPNVMQLALHTKIKLFYRPKAILPEKYSRWDNQLVLHKVNGGYRVENPTPYYMTVIGITAAPKVAVASGFQTVMVPPKSTRWSIVRTIPRRMSPRLTTSAVSQPCRLAAAVTSAGLRIPRPPDGRRR
jgi:P pilus assembly chaperone PapD